MARKVREGGRDDDGERFRVKRRREVWRKTKKRYRVGVDAWMKK